MHRLNWRWWRVAALLAISPLAFLPIRCQTHALDAAKEQTASGLSSHARENSTALDREVHSDMSFLASDELRGRGSGTRDEHTAALFAAAQFERLGLKPGGDDGSFIQKVRLPSPLPPRAQRRVSRFEDTPRTSTWNAIAVLPGTSESAQVILLTAHLDHLGVGPPNQSGDAIYNGADDDASGTTVVLALAHALADGPRLRRTVVFALFGSEEIGGFGNAGFVAHAPVPLDSIVANLEFEMVGRPDPAVPSDDLWLTGFERSNLGPELAKHGAPIVADPHPQENFFRRSDNIAMARMGIIAQTVSSFGLHKDYHQPSDELSKIDFNHLEHAVSSMIGPIRWLADTDWAPSWNPGGRPQ